MWKDLTKECLGIISNLIVSIFYHGMQRREGEIHGDRDSKYTEFSHLKTMTCPILACTLNSTLALFCWLDLLLVSRSRFNTLFYTRQRLLYISGLLCSLVVSILPVWGRQRNLGTGAEGYSLNKYPTLTLVYILCAVCYVMLCQGDLICRGMCTERFVFLPTHDFGLWISRACVQRKHTKPTNHHQTGTTHSTIKNPKVMVPFNSKW